MKITRTIIGAAFGLLFALGPAYAAPATCGAVTGALLVEVDPPPLPPPTDIEDLSGTPITCGGNAAFSWEGNDGFKVTATLANVGANMTIDLTMFTGENETAGFGFDAFWSFTLNGFVFDPTTIVEVQDDFVGGVAAAFENGNRTAKFTMGISADGYPANTGYLASYTVNSTPANNVPEPGTWHLVLASLGMLALTGPYGRNARRRVAA